MISAVGAVGANRKCKWTEHKPAWFWVENEVQNENRTFPQIYRLLLIHPPHPLPNWPRIWCQKWTCLGKRVRQATLWYANLMSDSHWTHTWKVIMVFNLTGSTNSSALLHRQKLYFLFHELHLNIMYGTSPDKSLLVKPRRVKQSSSIAL